MIESWLQAIRDHPKRPPAMQRHVLTMLAVRLDFRTGSGFVSTGTLMADADACERTVRSATAWARKAGLLIQVQRGHRRGDGTVSPSGWRISTGTGTPVENSQPANDRHLNRHAEQSYQEKPSRKLSVFAIAEVQRLTGRTITRDDAERGIKTKLDGKHPRHPQAYLKKIISDDPRWWLPTPQPPAYKQPARSEQPEPFSCPE